MTRLHTHYGPTAEDPNPGKEWHYDCGGEVLVFKDGIPTCMKCGDNTYEVCDHMALVDDECELCKEERQVMTKESDDAGDAMKDAMADVIRSVVSCEGLHPVATMKHVGTLELLICDDPQCAHITARCTHQIPIPEEEDSVPRKYTTSACKWNEEGTMLTCTFCGKDGT